MRTPRLRGRSGVFSAGGCTVLGQSWVPPGRQKFDLSSGAADSIKKGTRLALIKLHPPPFPVPCLGALEPSVALRMVYLGSISSCMAKPSPCWPPPCWKWPLLMATQMPLSPLVSFLGPQSSLLPRTVLLSLPPPSSAASL